MSSDRSQEIAEARRKLLEKRLKKAKNAQQETPEIKILPKPDDVAPRASLGQQRLWYVQQLRPESVAYHMTNAHRMSGELDIPALEKSIQTIVNHYDILRTRFVLEDGVLLQHIESDSHLSIDYQQATDSTLVDTLIQDFVNCPFDLTQAPLFRVLLISQSQSETDHILVLMLHHIISDEWSLDIIWRDLATCYNAYIKGVDPQLPQSDISYVDYSVWQHQQIEDSTYQNQLAYWQNQLSGDLPLLEMPTKVARPAIQAFEGALIERTLDKDLTQKIQTITKQANTTLFATLTAIYHVLLQRFAGQDDILVGIPVANRNQQQTENLIGFFLNTLVLRGDLSGDLTFRQHLHATAKQALTALSHQDIPFDLIVDELNPKRDPSYNPIFQTMLVYQDITSEHPKLDNLQLEPMQLDMGVSKFDMTLFARLEADGQIRLWLEYDTALFDQQLMQRVLQYYEIILETVLESPDAQLSTLEILTNTDRQQLAQWNETSTGKSHSQLIHDLILEHSADAIAIQSETGILTYGELVQQANWLAQQLLDKGVTPDTAIGLYAERSPQMFVGILGILLAGGAYIPLDPAYPQERINYLLDDAQIRIIVTQPSLVQSIPSTDTTAEIVQLTGETLSTTPTVSTTPDHLAYMIYTSGSTGKPKGVRVTHRNLVHSTTARFETYQHPVENFLLLSSFAFDSSLVGIFWTLCQGGTLCLPPHNGEKDIRLIGQLIERYHITHLLALPSLYQILLDFASDDSLQSLNTVIVAGEACPLSLVKQHYRMLPDTILYNEYGPTEGTVWATVWQIPPTADTMLIGQAIPDTKIHLVDDNLHRVPVGVVGEIMIGGQGITQGYHNLPKLTETRFLETSFGDGKCYRTGDLGRLTDDGQLEFLGRKDYQVKISGYRIELGEIEALLTAQDEVTNAVVLVNERQSQKELVSFVETSLTKSDIEDILRDQLPYYMIPKSIIVVADMPLTPNGKIDRNALSQRLNDATEESMETIETDNETIKTLVQIWETILERTIPNIRTDFFDLGGTSLDAIRMFAQLNQELSVDLPLSLLLQAPTIEKLADTIQSNNNDDTTLIPVSEVGVKAPLYIFQVNAVGGIIHYKYLLEHLNLNRPVYGVIENSQQDEVDFKAFALRHADTILAHTPDGPYFLLGLSVAGILAYEVARVLKQRGKSDVYVVMFDTYGPQYPHHLSPIKAVQSKVGGLISQFMDGTADQRLFLLNDMAWQIKFRVNYQIGKRFNALKKMVGMPVKDERLQLNQGGEAIQEVIDNYFSEDHSDNISILLYRAQLQPLSSEYSKTLNWDRYVPEKSIDVVPISGAHTSLIRDSVEPVAEHFQMWLDQKP